MKSKRQLIDAVTGITLCSIFVAAGYAILSPNFTSFGTPGAEAITCNSTCTTPMGSVGIGGSCMCAYEIPMTNPDGTEYCSPTSMAYPGLCTAELRCSTANFCEDPCEDPSVVMYPFCSNLPTEPGGPGAECNITCKSPYTGNGFGQATCTLMPMMQPCDVAQLLVCDTNTNTCTNVCESSMVPSHIKDLPSCTDEEIATGDSCACKKADSALSCVEATNTCVAGSYCSPSTKTCELTCGMTPGGCDNYRADCSTNPPSCVLDSVTNPTGNTSLAQCTAELPTSCPKYSLTCTGGAASCMPDTTGTYSRLSDCEAARTSPTPPVTCSSSSSSSSADMCCNLTTQACEPR